MANYELKTEGFAEFRKALERNPTKVKNEAKNFIQRALAKYRSGIQNDPWRIGMSGGGSPVLTGNLRDSHFTEIEDFRGSISPDEDKASYGKYVHKKRPWLDYVFKQKMPDVEKLEGEMLDNIVRDLAK